MDAQILNNYSLNQFFNTPVAKHYFFPLSPPRKRSLPGKEFTNKKKLFNYFSDMRKKKLF